MPPEPPWRHLAISKGEVGQCHASVASHSHAVQREQKIVNNKVFNKMISDAKKNEKFCGRRILEK